MANEHRSEDRLRAFQERRPVPTVFLKNKTPETTVVPHIPSAPEVIDLDTIPATTFPTFEEQQTKYPPNWNRNLEQPKPPQPVPIMDVETGLPSDSGYLYNPRRPTPYIRYKTAYSRKYGRKYKRYRRPGSAGAARYWKRRYWKRRITGRGDYVTPFGAAGSALGSWAGGKLGGMAGDFVGGMLTGVGDYTVKKNVLMSGSLPTMVNASANGGVVIRFQEYLTDIVSSSTAGAFKIQSFLLNPGQTGTFPWLSQLAANFEEYEFEGMVFGYKSMSADALNSTNTALGTVMLATQYDVNDAVFTSKTEMLNYEFSQAIKPSESCLHMIECARSQTVLSELYVLPAGQNVPSNSDPRFYHLGRFSIASQGLQGTSVTIGELHVTYQVRLLKPKLYDSLGETIPFTQATLTGASAPAWTNALPLGNSTQSYVFGGNSLGITIDQATSTVSIPNIGLRRKITFTFVWTGQVVSFGAPAVGVGNDIQVGTVRASTGNGATVGIMVFSVVCLGQSAGPSTFTLGNLGTLPTFPQDLLIKATQVDPDY